ncbi:MAG: hypothetical protein ACP6IY_01170 [Promethearchaeia archaeon]
MKLSENKFLFLNLKKTKEELIYELILPIIFLGCIGAFYWAIRGSAGYGGAGGGVFAGIGWALAWYFLSYESNINKRRPYSSGWVVIAITLGISIGGLHGYGQFVSWISGKFYINYPYDYVPINPIIGYLWFFQCGLAWGGLAGIFIGWCGSKEPLKLKGWCFRILFGIIGTLIGFIITYLRPDLINPLYNDVNYSTCSDCERNLSTSLSSMALLGLYLGFLVYEFIRKDWRNVALALTMGIGFGLAFSIFSFWHLFSGFSDLPLDWWKNWEMSIGFFGGATIAICFYLYNRPFEDDKISLIRIQPYSKYRKAEKIIGINLAITIALGWAIIGAISGVVEQQNLGESLIISIGIPLALICIIIFLISTLIAIKKPIGLEDKKSIINRPALLFAIIHTILIILGYIVSFTINMTFAHWFLIWIYTIFLIIGVSAFYFIFKYRK